VNGPGALPALRAKIDAVRLGEEIRIVACDLDGTLLRRDGSVSARTVAALGAAVAAGATVVLVTARPPRWVDPVAAELPTHPVAICCNGALTYDAHRRQLVDERPMVAAVALEAARRLRAELAGAVFAVEVGLAYGQEPAYPNRWPLPASTTVSALEALVTGPISTLIVRHEDQDDPWRVLERARRVVGGLAEVTCSGLAAPLEVVGPGVTKASALASLAAGQGVGAGGVLAFGDMPNDLALLGWAGTSVATANAHEDVLAAADHVTGDCDDDGVAGFLEGLLG
jgi:hydroxymethylpyrimidine pyrophosphatase-like HAD family hydrolase